jgi:hypothetical protein
VFKKVQLEVNQFGFIIYNANVDVPRHVYSSYLDQKMQQRIYRNR